MKKLTITITGETGAGCLAAWIATILAQQGHRVTLNDTAKGSLRKNADRWMNGEDREVQVETANPDQ